MTVESTAPSGDGVEAQRGWVERIGSDWWAVIAVGALTALAVVDLLPKIPW